MITVVTRLGENQLCGEDGGGRFVDRREWLRTATALSLKKARLRDSSYHCLTHVKLKAHILLVQQDPTVGSLSMKNSSACPDS